VRVIFKQAIRPRGGETRRERLFVILTRYGSLLHILKA
jgi:hypothetical protein